MKKRTLYTIFCMILVFMLSTVVAFAADSAYLGDVNNDGNVNAIDARAILRHSANLEKVNELYTHLADVNGDNKVNSSDARLALRMGAKLEDLFEFGEEYHLHDYETVFVKNATCIEEGKKQDVCKICGKITKESVVEKKPHTYVDKIEKEATCYTEGEKHSVCSSCGDTVVVTIEKLSHSYTEATCTNPKTCRICGVTQGDKKEHDYVTSSCFSPATCKNCGTTSGNAPGHTFSGLKCTKCGKQYDSMENYAIKCIREDLMYRLKNPNSLIINSIGYTIPNVEDCVFQLWINISAMNSYGGYTRDTIIYMIDKNGNISYTDIGYIKNPTMYYANVDYVKKQLGIS